MGNVNYTSHMVLRVTPVTEPQLTLLRELQSTSVDFWNPPTLLNRSVDIRVSPESYEARKAHFDSVSMPHEVIFRDIGKLIDNERNAIVRRRGVPSERAFDLENYHPINEIYGFVDQLITDYPNLVSKEVISTTVEGRDIGMATISTGSNPNKPIMFFECGIHAREWISSAVCIWFMNELVTKYGTDSEITSFVDTFDWKFVPVLNVDGYVHTWTTDRLWRKNRVPNSGICFGVDLNRNFEIGFGGPGSSNAQCSETYRGQFAFSERESQGIRNVMDNVGSRVKAAISVHSYSQLWMSPYSYTTEESVDYLEQNRVGYVAVDALSATYGTIYENGASADILYLASGVAADYYYDVHGVIYSYIVELRDSGLYGFVLPPEQIRPTAIETWNGLRAMTNDIMKTLMQN